MKKYFGSVYAKDENDITGALYVKRDKNKIIITIDSCDICLSVKQAKEVIEIIKSAILCNEDNELE